MRNISLYVLRELMAKPDKAFSTKELTLAIRCERKAVYSAIANLECTGFPIEVKQESDSLNGYRKINTYKWSGHIVGADI